jgi:hypothetical protein
VARPDRARGPVLVRALISVLVVAHFAAILTAVAAVGSQTFPAPPLVLAAYRIVEPYLRLAYLNNGYRFFAPNPGPVSLLWFRARHADGTVRWTEWPGPPAGWRGIPYQRRLSLAFLLQAHLGPGGPDRRVTVPGPTGRELMGAFVRFVARRAPAPVDRVDVYLVAHRMRMPYETQMGWGPADLRLYPTILYLGGHDAVGQPLPDGADGPAGVAVPPSELASRVIRRDVPAVPGGARDPAGAALPLPVRDLLVQFPAFRQPAEPDEAGLRAAIERAVVGRDRPEDIRDPARRAYELSLRHPGP